METQGIANLLGDADNESSKFATRKWYVINDQNNTVYGDRNENGTAVNFETQAIKLSLCDYLGAYILVAGDIATAGNDANTKVAFKNCAPFKKCITHINDEHVHTAHNLDIVMPMHILIEYSDNYSDTSGSLWQFKRDGIEGNVDLTVDANHIPNNSSSFKYKSSFITNRNGVKIAVPLKYLSNFWRSLEIPLINCKIHLELNWTKDCVMSAIADTIFKITNTNYMFQLLLYQAKTM